MSPAPRIVVHIVSFQALKKESKNHSKADNKKHQSNLALRHRCSYV